MFGIGSKTSHSSMTPVYLFLFIFLLTNQFLFIHSYVYIHDGQDQSQLEHSRPNALRQLVAKYLTTSDESSSDDNDLFKQTVQRRFCCMSPLSGRKRFIRDLARKQQSQQLSNELHQ